MILPFSVLLRKVAAAAARLREQGEAKTAVVAAAALELVPRMMAAQGRRARDMLADVRCQEAVRPIATVQAAAVRVAREPMLPQQHLTALAVSALLVQSAAQRNITVAVAVVASASPVRARLADGAAAVAAATRRVKESGSPSAVTESPIQAVVVVAAAPATTAQDNSGVAQAAATAAAALSSFATRWKLTNSLKGFRAEKGA